MNKLVTILKPTPSEAAIASSRIIGIGTSSNVTKETKAVTSASVPGISRPLKLARAACIAVLPCASSRMMKLICCTPCETPMANTRNGTSTPSGSSPKPSRCNAPNCQTSEVSEHTIGSTVNRTERLYQNTAAAVSSSATLQKRSTEEAPSAMSPICLAKPMISMS